ncbi:MAG TPA: sulfotransferase [Woeseiaceae bacterium]|nr:sulfotransferase [Woeseiaceae bacterium]
MVHTYDDAGAAGRGSTKITETLSQQELFRHASALLQSGDAAAAAAACERALKAFPADGNLLCLAARADIALRRLDAARRRVEAALAQYPDHPLAHDTLGDLRIAAGDPEGARAAYARALELDPALGLTRRKVAKARQLAAGGSEDRRNGKRSRRMAFAGDLEQAERHRKQGENDKAEAIYRRILKEDPDHVDAIRLLAEMAGEHDRHREAEVFLKRAVALAPHFVRAWADLANTQRQLDKFDEALASARRVLELAPGKPESCMLEASVLGSAGRHEEAIAAFGRVLELDASRTGALCAMAHHLKTVGRRSEAIESYRDCIALEPSHGESWWSLANLKTFRFRDDEVEVMLEQLEADNLSDESRLQINNALGLEFEARGEYARAFSHFDACNRLRRSAESYDPVDTESTHDRIIEQFDAKFLAQPPGPDVRPVPIFIVGLPRSGSTLLEQILASHSQVEGTHELTELSRALRDLRRGARRERRFPEIVAKLDRAGWTALGRDYLDGTAKFRRAGRPVFIDKNPNNFAFAGLIRLALPNAKIVDARRHPLDSCFGTWKQLFASGQPFSYDLTEVGEYYLQYDRLMRHWHAVMPGYVLEVRYEDVVANLEGQVRRLLDFCELPFEENCLNFHETARAVKTASSEQVRRPIYSSSVNLWRHYEAELETLIEILEPLLRALPPGERPGSLQAS